MIVGGDFTTQLGISRRGQLLDEFAPSCGLSIANDSANEFESWTFQSAQGIRWRLDYVLATSSTQILSASAVEVFDIF